MHPEKNLESYLAGTCSYICPVYPEHDLLATATGAECKTGGGVGQERLSRDCGSVGHYGISHRCDCIDSSGKLLQNRYG